MVNNHKVRESGSHFAVTALTSAGIFAIIAILVVMLVAAAVIKAFMPVPSIGYAINAALLVASFAGTFYGCKKIGGKYAVISAVNVTAFLFLLVATNVIVFNGEFHKIGLPIAAVILGSMIACFISSKGSSGKGRRKIRFR